MMYVYDVCNLDDVQPLIPNRLLIQTKPTTNQHQCPSLVFESHPEHS